MSIENEGLETVRHPITHVRLSNYGRKWYVEYRRKPQFFFDQYWWFDDSIHSNYADAYVRAQTLTALGYYETIEKKKIEFNVTKDDNV